MKLYKYHKKSEDILFECLIGVSVLAYGLHAVYLIVHGSYALWTIDTSMINIGIIGKIVPYIKDILVMVLFVVLYIRYKRSREAAFYFFGLVILGSVILIGSQNWDIRYCIAGIRMYLYPFTVMMWCQSRMYKCNVKHLYNLICVLSVTEFILVFLQIWNSGILTQFGYGGWRFCGSFGNSGGLGSFAFAASLYLFVADSSFASSNNKLNVILLIMNLLVSIASGMRSVMLPCILVVFSCLLNRISFLINIKKKSKYAIFCLAGICGAPIVYQYVLERAGRGTLMESGGTRIGLFYDLVHVTDFYEFCQLIIGKGIGYGTNNSVNLGVQSAEIMDGTINTTIAQFGLVGFAVIVFFFIRISINILKYGKGMAFVPCSFIAGIGILSLTGNIFEQISAIIILIYTYYLIKIHLKRVVIGGTANGKRKCTVNSI